MVLDFGLTTIAVILIVPIISWIFRMSGDMWYIYVWVSMAVFCVFLMMIYPSFIAPLFNKFEQLPEGPLRDGMYGNDGDGDVQNSMFWLRTCLSQ